MLLEANAIKWIKNINDGVNYGGYLGVVSEFHLHVPDIHKGNVLTPKCGDLILLFQRVGLPTKNNANEVVFTHLVTPVDNRRGEEPDNNGYIYSRRVKLIAKCVHEPFIKVNDTLFKNINMSGVVNGNFCAIENINDVKNKGLLTDIQEEIRNAFLPYVCGN